MRERFPGLRVGRLDRDVVERRGAAARVVDAFSRRPPRRARRDEPGRQGPRHPGGDAGRRRLVRRRPEPARRAGRGADVPVPRARPWAARAGASGRAARSSRPTSRTTRRSWPWPTGDAAAFYDAELELRRRFGSPPFGRLVKLTIGLAGSRRPRSATGWRWRIACAPARRSGGATSTVAGPAPAYIARRADRWRFNVVLRGTDPVALLDGGVDAPWSVDVDPESLL